jgi:hypothetical protein
LNIRKDSVTHLWHDAIMTPQECSRFLNCNAAVCPLDVAWRKIVHLRSEKVCYYLLAVPKAAADERFANDPVFAAVKAAAPAVCAKHTDIAKRVQKAGQSGFQGAHLIRRTAS